ncbi:DNA translocase FtsK [Patescibacteria group bacterium]|nr:DNA translocase FtsK [Patescibacteria group bacterium]MBU4580493.1 DNA translocase FtsK [Patescibacteria group bacterium]
MSRNKRKNKNNQSYSKRKYISKGLKYNILAIIFFALGVISILGLIGVNDPFSAKIYWATRLLFGHLFILAPVFLFLGGLSLVAKTSDNNSQMRRFNYSPVMLIVFTAALLSFLALVNLVFFPHDFRSIAANLGGGGYLGLIFSIILTSFTGPAVASVILIMAIAIFALFIFNISLESFLSKIIYNTKAFYNYYRFISQIKKSKKTKIEEEHYGDNIAAMQKENGKKNGAKPSFKIKSLEDKENDGPNDQKENKEENFSAENHEYSEKLAKKKARIMAQWSKFPLNLLESDFTSANSGDIGGNASIIEKTLSNFGIEVEMGKVFIGPTVSQYTLKPAVGVKLSKITALQNDLALSLAASSIRIEAPIPGKSLVGIEIPNVSAAIVRLRNLLETFPNFYKNEYFASLKVAMGLDVSGSPHWVDLGGLPHLLIAGSTGSGKTIFVNNLIMSLIYNNSPEALKLILIDPKRVELTLYNNIPHLLTPVIVENEKAVGVLKWVVAEMERRYIVLAEAASRDIDSYNKKMIDSKAEDSEPMSYIVVVIDELADLMATFPREVEAAVVRLAQMSRAVGIHLVISTQRPSVNVITGLIKANITARIAFRVASLIDSRTILDHSGAEKLLGRGDMLYLATGTAKPKRLQGCFVSESEVKKVVRWLKENNKEGAQMLDETVIAKAPASSIEFSLSNNDVGGDELYEQAKEMVIRSKKASASLLQRRFRVGYARAARLLDLLEEQGIIGPSDGAKPRAILAAESAASEGLNTEFRNDRDAEMKKL